jgi:hypothetical protein
MEKELFSGKKESLLLYLMSIGPGMVVCYRLSGWGNGAERR